MQIADATIFADVSESLGIGNPAIVEKDYYVVQLLQLLIGFNCPHHDMVFAGGTALAKANIKLQRMSEDVDIKLVTRTSAEQESKSAMRKHRKAIRDDLIAMLNGTNVFSVNSDNVISRDENRYIEIPVEYRQHFTIAPCLRPFIKLELIETDLLTNYSPMTISSLHNEAMNEAPEISAFNVVELISTQAEKILSMLRRTASVCRDPDRDDDHALVRHIYDTYQLSQAHSFELAELAGIMAKGIRMDSDRYGRQHQEFVAAPTNELRYGLNQIGEQGVYKERYKNFVGPMVYGAQITWEDAWGVFSSLATESLDYIDQHNLLR